jgi:thymidine phosphorylase
MVHALGGPADILARYDQYLAAAPVVRPVFAAVTGRIVAVDTRALGLAVVALGGGRTRASDPVDPAVGLTALAGIGDAAGPDVPLAFIHARDDAAFAAAAATVRAAYTVGENAARPPLLAGRIAE